PDRRMVPSIAAGSAVGDPPIHLMETIWGLLGRRRGAPPRPEGVHWHCACGDLSGRCAGEAQVAPPTGTVRTDTSARASARMSQSLSANPAAGLLLFAGPGADQ